MMKFTRAVVPAPLPQPVVPPPGPERSVSLNSALMYGPCWVAETYWAPHGSSRLTSSTAARLWSTKSSCGPLTNTLGIWKYSAAARTCPVRSAVDHPLITSTDCSNALGFEIIAMSGQHARPRAAGGRKRPHDRRDQQPAVGAHRQMIADRRA